MTKIQNGSWHLLHHRAAPFDSGIPIAGRRAAQIGSRIRIAGHRATQIGVRIRIAGRGALEASGGFWKLLEASGGFWMLLEASGGFWEARLLDLHALAASQVLGKQVGWARLPRQPIYQAPEWRPHEMIYHSNLA